MGNKAGTKSDTAISRAFHGSRDTESSRLTCSHDDPGSEADKQADGPCLGRECAQPLQDATLAALALVDLREIMRGVRCEK